MLGKIQSGAAGGRSPLGKQGAFGGRRPPDGDFGVVPRKGHEFAERYTPPPSLLPPPLSSPHRPGELRDANVTLSFLDYTISMARALR